MSLTRVPHPDCPVRGSGHHPHQFQGPVVDGVKMVGSCDGEIRTLTQFDTARRPGESEVGKQILEREIRSSLGYIINLLATRRAHPTYGVTKTSLNNAVKRAEGLLVAHMILSGSVSNFNVGGNPVERWASDHFDYDLADLKGQVKSA